MHLSGRKKIEVANRVELHACTDYARTHRSITRQLNQNSRGACTTRQIKKKLALGQRWRLRRQKIGGAFPLLRLTRAPAKTTQRRGWLLGRAKILALNRTRTESYGRANFFVRLSLTSIQTNHKHLAHPTFFSCKPLQLRPSLSLGRTLGQLVHRQVHPRPDTQNTVCTSRDLATMLSHWMANHYYARLR
jgi:hypothetical protein